MGTASRCPARSNDGTLPAKISPPQTVPSAPYPTPSIAIPTQGSRVTDAMWATWCWTGTAGTPSSVASSRAYRVERNWGWRSWATASYRAPSQSPSFPIVSTRYASVSGFRTLPTWGEVTAWPSR